jgi:hypothetical protein
LLLVRFALRPTRDTHAVETPITREVQVVGGGQISILEESGTGMKVNRAAQLLAY